MTTRQFKRTAFCIGVMGLWLALATPTFAAKAFNIDFSPATCARAHVEGTASAESIPMETCRARASGYPKQ